MGRGSAGNVDPASGLTAGNITAIKLQLRTVQYSPLQPAAMDDDDVRFACDCPKRQLPLHWPPFERLPNPNSGFDKRKGSGWAVDVRLFDVCVQLISNGCQIKGTIVIQSADKSAVGGAASFYLTSTDLTGINQQLWTLDT